MYIIRHDINMHFHYTSITTGRILRGIGMGVRNYIYSKL